MAAANLSDNNPATAAGAHHSRHSGQNISSPKSRRSTRPASSPWTQIFRDELEIPAVVPSSLSNMTSSTAIAEPSSPSPSSSLAAEESVGERSESGNGSQTNAGNKPAWNKLSNGAVEVVGPVMGAVSWPALSESTRFTTKSSLESPKGSADGSVGAACQGIGNPPSSPQEEFSSASPTSTPTPNLNPNQNPTPTPTPTLTPTHRQKSMKRSGAGNSYNGGVSQQSTVPGSIIETASSNPSSKDQIQRSSFASQSHNDHNYQHQRNSFRSRGSGYPRGDGSHHHNHGSRRDHDRGNHDWNPHRNYGQPQRVVQRYVRPSPPPSTATFIPPSIRPLGGHVPFHEFVPPVVYVAAPPPEAFRGVPFVAPIPPNAVFFPTSDPQLYSKIVYQIEYYFSGENLIKDTFLRENMDEDGWVPIKLVASFKMVRALTDNIPVILDALRTTSTMVEVQGDKVRRRNDYSRWIILPSTQTSNVVASSPANSSQDMLAAGVQSITLETNNRSFTEGRGDFHVEALQSRSPRNFHSQSQPPGTGKPNIETGLDHSFSGRN